MRTRLDENGMVRRSLLGSAAGIATAAALSAAMLPVRSHVSIATSGLVLVVPVVIGVILGGYPGGLATVVAGFLLYDFLFIPPYYTLTVGALEDWVALGVFVAVLLLVAQVVVHLDTARSQAQQRAVEAQRLYELSELLVGDRSVPELLDTIASTVQTVFDVAGVAVLLPVRGRLVVAASAGDELSPGELRRLASQSGLPVPVGTVQPGGPGQVRAVALSAAGRPVGILALHGLPASASDRDMLRTFANHAALALDRAQLRSQARRSELLEEVDRIRRALLGAVSHDLRTPLATMKVASSTLLDPDSGLTDEATRELYRLLDIQTDRLTRLVTSLLDMTRHEAGALVVDRQPWFLADVVEETVAAVRPSLGDRPLEVVLPEGLPPVFVDRLLIGQVLANLLDNADRHAPVGTAITIAGERRGDHLALSVTDRGSGVPVSDRESVFQSFVRYDTGGRSGLGLAIAKTFVEAHGESIWVEDVPGGGARFVTTLPVATPSPSAADGRPVDPPRPPAGVIGPGGTPDRRPT
jgi:two-component system, OmpR family, sensor histidine kinase KdpD